MLFRQRLRVIATLVLAASFAASAAVAAPLRLPPQKDQLFAFPGILQTQNDGDFVVVAYDKQRDIHVRDEVPEKKVQWKYVDTGVNWQQRHVDYKGGGGRNLRTVVVGPADKPASMIVVFLHGQNGTRFLGADDWSFGGNFNRIKNMVVKAGGVYLSPDFTDFGAKGAADVKALMMQYARLSPGAPIFLACGSYGGKLCWALADDPQASSLLSGMLLMGTMPDEGFLSSAALKRGRPIPLYFGHGSDDNVFAWQDQAGFFEQIRNAVPGYPSKFVLFQTGSHGTPIRMTDWRATINWMLQVDGY
ncbi:hypothetical protein SAMN02745157_1842 [Kaistia soli DSM 19436]|uniref:Alpha/beta hydrolase family protein n=1 Tax=Kaistia soli DSM 19436 TaxID=1122133 RepID=A0A1M4ZK38_9HYPH|nr:alpha/beta fold hydrolase [Kaistia soli]SHF18413.1 hypothetical protein SAMN02745157_1842 [Kaistia soli DSM 19436]